MKDSKLVRLLRMLNSEEQRALSRFLSSPYHNSNQQLIFFWEQLQNFSPMYNHPQLEKKKFFSRLYPNSQYRDRRMRDLMSDLTLLIEDFLVVQRLHREPVQREILLAEALREKSAYDLSLKSFQKATSLQPTARYPDLQDYWRQTYIFQSLYYNPEFEQFQTDEHLLKATTALDHLFLLGKLRHSCEFFWRRHILKKNNQFHFFPQLIAFAEQWKEENSLLHLYYNLHQLQNREDDLSLLQETRSLFLSCYKGIGQVEQRVILLHLINHAVAQANAGNLPFRRELLNLFKLALENDNLLFFGDQLLEGTFLNITITAAICKDFVFLLSFIRRYLSRLPEECRKDAKLSALAYYFFHKGNYQQALNLAQQAPHSNIQYKLRMRALALRCYYEKYCQKELEELTVLQKCENFRHYLFRDSIFSEERRKGYYHLIRMIQDLVKFRAEKRTSSEDCMVLFQKLEKRRPVIAKEWLLEKIDDLGKENKLKVVGKQF